MWTRATFALFSTLLALPALGQSVGANIGGTVADTTGGVLPGAAVTITHVHNGRRVVLKTGERGDYRAVALQPGEYEVAAEQSGFATHTQRLTVLVGSDATLNFTLAVAGIESRTTVTAQSPLVEPSRSQPSSVVTRSEIDGMPVFGRNFLTLAQLLPGSGPINATVNRFASTKFGGPADQRSGYTTIVDGGDIDDAQWGSTTINVGQDAVQEFKVFRHQFDAQYGHALNAVVTVATRSGTNDFNGTGFYFGRDRALNARNYFASDKPPFDEQRGGMSLGGPVVRDRTHFFGAYERDNLDTVRIVALPPANPFSTGNGIFAAASDNETALAKLDHRVSPANSFMVRYGGDRQQSLRAQENVASDTSQVDIRNQSHSLVFEAQWAPTSSTANALRVHLFNHTLGTTPRSTAVGIRRPAGTIGQTNNDSQVLPQTRLTVFDVAYRHSPRHDFKIGGEVTLGTQDNDSHVFEYGLFEFSTDAPFDAANRSTWPTVFSQQKPSLVTYRSNELALFVQDDVRIGNRLTVNAGLRYDVDFNLRLNEFYENLLDSPLWTGLDRFVSRDRGTDTNNVQPRLGITWDVHGKGRLIVRGGWGMYVTRNRPWFQLRSMNQFTSSAIRITDANRLQYFPDINAVLGGRSIDEIFAAGAARQLGTVIPDDFVQPYALATTAGAAWQLNAHTALNIDYIHDYANHQSGLTDRNLPPSGPISVTNSRPVSTLGQVLVLDGFSKSWYDALETQWQTTRGRTALRTSYVLSRSYLDGVDFFVTTRGTQRTPHERGYNPSDQRHNLTVAGTISLPWSLEVSGIAKLISGSPIKVQAGLDLDGDTIGTGDLPPEIPITIGRARTEEALAAINVLRASRSLPALDPALLKLDPYRSVDLRLTKRIAIGRGQRVEMLLEGFNVTNHVNFRAPLGNPPNAGASINTQAFLVRTVARDARQIQWGLRYTF